MDFTVLWLEFRGRVEQCSEFTFVQIKEEEWQVYKSKPRLWEKTWNDFSSRSEKSNVLDLVVKNYNYISTDFQRASTLADLCVSENKFKKKICLQLIRKMWSYNTAVITVQ